jgi:translation initiation factor IF-1
MAKDDYVTIKGTVTDALPGNKYKVTLENDHKVLAYLGGKMKQFRIFVIEGDKVDVEVSIYDPTQGRISYRHK